MRCCGGCSEFSSREELVYDFVRKNGGDVERAKAFVPRALSLLDRGVLSRSDFLDRLFANSYADIPNEDFWQAYDAYMEYSQTQKGGA